MQNDRLTTDWRANSAADPAEQRGWRNQAAMGRLFDWMQLTRFNPLLVMSEGRSAGE
jgi:hypothetical protein